MAPRGPQRIHDAPSRRVPSPGGEGQDEGGPTHFSVRVEFNLMEHSPSPRPGIVFPHPVCDHLLPSDGRGTAWRGMAEGQRRKPERKGPKTRDGTRRGGGLDAPLQVWSVPAARSRSLRAGGNMRMCGTAPFRSVLLAGVVQVNRPSDSWRSFQNSLTANLVLALNPRFAYFSPRHD